MMRERRRQQPLGKRGKQVLEQISLQTAARGYPPSLQEMATAIGISVAVLRVALDDLYDRNLVQWEPAKPRTVRVVPQAVQHE